MAPLVCPQCGAEYRAGITSCGSCKVDLVDGAGLKGAVSIRTSARDELKDVKTVRIPQGNLSSARDLETLILNKGFNCFVHAEEADTDVALGSAATIIYAVVIAESDLPEIQASLRGQLEDSMTKQGLGKLQTEALNVDEGDVTCPACGHQGALVDGHCADCELFLGATD